HSHRRGRQGRTGRGRARKDQMGEARPGLDAGGVSLAVAVALGRLAVVLALFSGACGGASASTPAGGTTVASEQMAPCARLVRCCKGINRDDPKAQAECDDYAAEAAKKCEAMHIEVRRRFEGVLPPACR